MGLLLPFIHPAGTLFSSKACSRHCRVAITASQPTSGSGRDPAFLLRPSPPSPSVFPGDGPRSASDKSGQVERNLSLRTPPPLRCSAHIALSPFRMLRLILASTTHHSLIRLARLARASIHAHVHTTAIGLRLLAYRRSRIACINARAGLSVLDPGIHYPVPASCR